MAGEYEKKWEATWSALVINENQAPFAPLALRHACQFRDFRNGIFIRLQELRANKAIQAQAPQFLILTAVRLSEVLGATWDEFGEDVWSIPAERTKLGQPHRVPLSDAAWKILEQMAEIRTSDFVFPGKFQNTSISGGALRALLPPDCTLHGMRAAFATWAAERTQFAFVVREAALAHQVGNAVSRAYDRSDLLDKRQQLMADWAVYCGF